MEGGKYWERSQGEIEAMVASATVPADLQQLVEKRWVRRCAAAPGCTLTALLAALLPAAGIERAQPALPRPCRLRGERVAGLLKSGRPSEALELLVEQPELAWVKDGESGGYPIHLAAWHGE